MDATEFSRKGRLNAGVFGVLLFVNLFWNSIVGLISYNLLIVQFPGNGNVPKEWWFGALFLTPFMLIGLSMFAALTVVSGERFRRYIWRVERHRVVYLIRSPFRHRTQDWEIAQLDRVELRDFEIDNPAGQGLQRRASIIPFLRGESLYRLAFVSTDGSDLCVLRDLTEGEGRWMGRHLLTERASWFPCDAGRR